MARFESMGGVTLDVPAICRLAVFAGGLRETVSACVEENEKLIKDLKEQGVLEGEQGEGIQAAFDELSRSSKNILDLVNSIYTIANIKAEKMDAAYREHGGQAQAELLKNTNQQMRPRK